MDNCLTVKLKQIIANFIYNQSKHYIWTLILKKPLKNVL